MKSEILHSHKNRCTIYINNGELKDQIIKIKGCEITAWYKNPDDRYYAWNVSFPMSVYNEVALVVGFPLREKNPKRVAQGKKLGKLAVKKGNLRVGNNPPISHSQNLELFDLSA